MTSFPLLRPSTRRLILLFLWNCHTGSRGKPPVQCSYFDLCIFLDREPFIHCRGPDALRGVDVMPKPLALCDGTTCDEPIEAALPLITASLWELMAGPSDSPTEDP